jgi:hypothetical protein
MLFCVDCLHRQCGVLLGGELSDQVLTPMDCRGLNIAIDAKNLAF